MAGADYNQQRAAKTVVAAIASIVAAAATTVAAAVAAVAMKGADYNQQRGKDSMYTVRVPRIQIGKNFSANKNKASSECPNIWVLMFGIETYV